jgi:serine/threonine protein kinase
MNFEINSGSSTPTSPFNSVQQSESEKMPTIDQFVTQTMEQFGNEAKFKNRPFPSNKISGTRQRKEKIQGRIKNIYNVNLDTDSYKDQLNQLNKKNKIKIKDTNNKLSVDVINKNGNIEYRYITGHRIGQGFNKNVKITIDSNRAIYARVCAIYISTRFKETLEREYEVQALFKGIKEFVQLEYSYTCPETKKVIGGMEYCNAGDLETFVKNRENLNDIEQMKAIFHDIFYALRVVEAKGFAHKDIKPANIMLHKDENGQIHAKIGDFGSAAKKNQPSKNDGSPAYMALDIVKETQLSENVNISIKGIEKADVWSTGQVVYETLYKTLLIEDFGAEDTNQLYQISKTVTQEKINNKLEEKKRTIENPNAFITGMQDMLQMLTILDRDKRPTAEMAYAAYCEKFGLMQKSIV